MGWAYIDVISGYAETCEAALGSAGISVAAKLSVRRYPDVERWLIWGASVPTRRHCAKPIVRVLIKNDGRMRLHSIEAVAIPNPDHRGLEQALAI